MSASRRSEPVLGNEFDIAAFRASRIETPLAGYEALLSSDRWTARRVGETDAILSDGWKRGSLPRVRVQPPVAWSEICSSNRSWQFHLQAWEPMSIVLSAFDHLGDRRYIDYSLAVALDWIQQYPSTDIDRDFAWYDMAIGLRAYRLGYILDVVSRDEHFEDPDVEALARAAVVHAQALLEDERFISHNNHGLYQAAGEVALARRFPELPSMHAALEQGRERLDRMLRTQFTADGVHREHSPGYHYLLLDTLERLLICDLLFDAESKALAESAQEALAWMAMPDRRLVMIGDTSERVLQDEPFNQSPNEALRFVVTAGGDGKPPAERLKEYPHAGYVVMRNRWPGGRDGFSDCSYLMQIAAFHSRAHKHADDFSFVWFDRERELLVDSGRYGYLGRLEPDSELGQQGFMYSDPNRIYVESTRAHNTVEIDGLSHPRRVEPYGSGLVGTGDTGDVMWSECCARFHSTVEHRRLLLLHPASWLVVVDALCDVAGQSHRYSQRFHFAPELSPVDGCDPITFDIPESRDRLFAVPLLAAGRSEVVSGQTEPELLGFVSRDAYEMLPASTAAFLGEGAGHVFATLLALDEQPPDGALDGNALDATGRVGELNWQSGTTRHRLRIGDEGDGLRVIYREASRLNSMPDLPR